MMTTGMPRSVVFFTSGTSALLSCGARTSPWMPRLPTICWTMPICSRVSLSLAGPFQRICTAMPCSPRSAAARSAPRWIDCQNSCVSPLGTTAMVYLYVTFGPPQPVGSRQPRTAR